MQISHKPYVLKVYEWSRNLEIHPKLDQLRCDQLYVTECSFANSYGILKGFVGAARENHKGRTAIF
jgi:hypothetical protein